MSYHKSEPAKIKSQSDRCHPALPHKNGARTKKIPKKITDSYLHNAGLYYLGRFSSSKQHFVDVMLRKVKKSCAAHKDQDFDSCRQMVLKLADRFEESGLLNDTLYTHGMITSMRRRGASANAITQKLKAKGIAVSKEALNEHDQTEHHSPKDAEFSAALVFARKKKIGQFSMNSKNACAPSQEQSRKWLSAFARAGFSYEISLKIINLTETDFENQEF